MSTLGLYPDTMHVKVTVLAEADVGSMSVRPGPSTVTVSGPSDKYQQAREFRTVCQVSTSKGVQQRWKDVTYQHNNNDLSHLR